MKKFMMLLLTAFIFVTGTSAFANEVDCTSMANALMVYKIVNGYEDGELHLDNNLTRAEAVTIICRLLSVEPAEDTNCVFTDVEHNFWAKNYIVSAFQNGLVDGCGDNLFKPNNNITYAEITKMIVTALGYTPRAKELGTYPSGYENAAKEMGILNGIIYRSSELITRDDMVKLVYAALDTPIMQQTSFGADAGYTVMDGNNGTPMITLRRILEEK